MNFLSLPAYAAPNALNFAPLNQAFQNQAQNALAQRQLDMQQQRLGFEAEAAQRANQLFPGQLELQRGQINAQTASLAQPQNMTPDQRRAFAPTVGIDVNSDPGRGFIVGGTYTPTTGQFIHRKPGEDIIYGDPKSGRTSVIYGGGDETQRKFDEAYATGEAPKQLTEWTGKYQDASSRIYKIQDMQRLAQYASTGWGVEGETFLRRMASRFMDPQKAQTLPATELFRTIQQDFVLSAAQKLKPVSNTDIPFVERGVATIASDPSTLPYLLPHLEREAQREALAADLYVRNLRTGRPPDPVAIEREVNSRLPSTIKQAFADKTQKGVYSTGPEGERVQKATTNRIGEAPAGTPPAPGQGTATVYNWSPDKGLEPVGGGAAGAAGEAAPEAPTQAAPMSPVQQAIAAQRARQGEATAAPARAPSPVNAQPSMPVGQRMQVDLQLLAQGRVTREQFISRYANAYRNQGLNPTEQALYDEIRNMGGNR